MTKSMLFILVLALINFSSITSVFSSNLLNATDSKGNTYIGYGALSPRESIKINCKYNSPVKWLKAASNDGAASEILSSQNIEIIGNELKINNIEFKDSGVYFCDHNAVAFKFFLYVFNITKTTNGIVPTKTISDVVNGIEINQTKISEKEGVNVSCFCESGINSQQLTIIWKGGRYEKFSKKYSLNTTRTSNGVNSTLILKKAEDNKDFYGEYTCACSAVSGTKQESKVYIQVPPIFDDHQSSMRTIEGSDVVLTCEVWGYPAVIKSSIHWSFQNKSVLRDGITTKMNESLPGFSQLLISKVTSDDRGIYTCHATNAIGSNSASTMLRVKGRYAALWPFIGIVVQLIILIAIIAVYEFKKSQKSKADNSKANFDPKNELEPVCSDRAEEPETVRQRLVNA